MDHLPTLEQAASEQFERLTDGGMSPFAVGMSMASPAIVALAGTLRREDKAKRLGEIYGVDWHIFLDDEAARQGMAGIWVCEPLLD